MSKASIDLGPPEIKSSPQPQQVLEDEPTSLSCTYRAMDPPVSQIRWLRDNVPVQEASIGPSRYRFVENSGNSTLVIRSVHLIDKGNYVCEITTHGYAPIKSKPAAVGIKEKLKFSPEPVSRRLELNSTVKVDQMKPFMD